MKKESLSSNVINIPDKTVVGIDIGSRQAKGVLLHQNEIYTSLIPTGFFMQENADHLLEDLLKQSNLAKEAVEYIVVTGYGRISLSFENTKFRSVTEIACHGKGAYLLADGVRTIIDIGGQDSKVIKIDETDGHVIDFAMNDKCAAGSGRFLEKMANVLGYSVSDMGADSLKADKEIPINSTCVVFAESEVISGRAKGESTSDLAAGINFSVARRVYGLLNKIGIEPGVLFTGGVSGNPGMIRAFEKLMGTQILKGALDTVYAGALGAAAFAAEYAENKVPSVNETHISGSKTSETERIEFTGLRDALDKHFADFSDHAEGKKAYVGYVCSYIPLEILSAANVSYIRLMNKGSSEEVAAGENSTQSMQCDFHKSLIGGFAKGRPEYKAIEKLYSFNVCSCMRKTLEAIDSGFVSVDLFNLPKNRRRKDSELYLANEMKGFVDSLEKLTGERISREVISERLKKFDHARKLIREIAEYRKVLSPIVNSGEFQLMIRAYYSLPIDTLIPELEKIREKLSGIQYRDNTRLKIMISGGILASGDDKIISILNDLGADVVAEDNCTGIKPFYSTYDGAHDEDIFGTLSRLYMGKAPCASMFSVDEMLDNTIKIAREYDVDGVLFYYLKFCSCFSLLEKEYERRFKDEDMALYILPGDYAAGDEGQIKTRLEAFIEMLRVKKDISLAGGQAGDRK